MIEGFIFEIQRWSTDDGPGIRSTIFFHGCPLRCLWCCNPEAWAGPGAPMAAEAILEAVERDRVFYRRSGGGVTFSGGEATGQPELLAHLAERLHNSGIHLTLVVGAEHKGAGAGGMDQAQQHGSFVLHWQSPEIERGVTGFGHREVQREAEGGFAVAA